MNVFLEYSNLITLGNILTVITGIGSVITAAMFVYWKVKRYWAEQQYAYEKRIQDMFDVHTKTLESCIHSIPGHPENPLHVVVDEVPPLS